MDWFNNDKGFASASPKKNYIKRFWMPNNSDRLITFVDAPLINLNGVQVATPFKYNEYTLNLNGHWRNYFTKSLNPEDDVLGQMEYKASKVAAMTIIDHSSWEDKSGTVHKDQPTLYIIKRSQPIWTQLTKIVEREGSLSGKTFRVHRMGDKSPACGVMLEKHNEDFPLTEEHQPFNYLEILKPKSKAELEALFSNEDPFSQGAQAQQQGWGAQAQQQAPQQGWSNQAPPQQAPQQAPQQNWSNQAPQQQSPQDNRTYGMTSGNSGVPF